MPLAYLVRSNYCGKKQRNEFLCKRLVLGRAPPQQGLSLLENAPMGAGTVRFKHPESKSPRTITPSASEDVIDGCFSAVNADEAKNIAYFRGPPGPPVMQVSELYVQVRMETRTRKCLVLCATCATPCPIRAKTIFHFVFLKNSGRTSFPGRAHIMQCQPFLPLHHDSVRFF